METMWVMLISILLLIVGFKAFGVNTREALGVVPDVYDPPGNAREVWRVKFAKGWYECQPISADPRMGLGIVRLIDRRTHSRNIIRRLDEIRLVE